MSELKAKVAERGGNPECLHCRLSTLLQLHLEQHENDVKATEIVTSIAETLGDIISQAPAPMILQLLGEAASIMAGRCGVTVQANRGATGEDLLAVKRPTKH